MAAKSSKSTSKNASDEAHVTRVTASDSTPSKKATAQSGEAAQKVTKGTTGKKARFNPIKALGGYFKGSWYELRQVRWPDRRATWGLTVAVLLFTAFFIVLIVALDAGFKFIFDKILS